MENICIYNCFDYVIDQMLIRGNKYYYIEVNSKSYISVTIKSE